MINTCTYDNGGTCKSAAAEYGLPNDIDLDTPPRAPRLAQLKGEPAAPGQGTRSTAVVPEC